MALSIKDLKRITKRLTEASATQPFYSDTLRSVPAPEDYNELISEFQFAVASTNYAKSQTVGKKLLKAYAALWDRVKRDDLNDYHGSR